MAKKSPLRTAGKCIGIIIGIIIVAFAALIGVLTLTEFNPAQTEDVEIQNAGAKTLSKGSSIDVLTWNTGYCGLSETADFFMDGGAGVRTVDEAGVKDNLANIQNLLTEQAPDIALLQEVDLDSGRSWHIDQGATYQKTFGEKGYSSAFAPNYSVLFVPFPWPPLGKVESSIQTLNSFATSANAQRIQLPCPFSWPIRTANLKRCLLVERIPIEGTENELVVINLHLEAYDSGEGKRAQTAQLAEFMRSESARGNYVIAGGDFNQGFSSLDTTKYPVQSEDLWQCGLVDVSKFGSGFSFCMDTATPTCRSLDRAYDPDDPTFQYYMIDGFIVSKNLNIESLETMSTGFDYSDHNPVKITVTLK